MIAPLSWSCFRFPVLLINATTVTASCSDSVFFIKTHFLPVDIFPSCSHLGWLAVNGWSQAMQISPGCLAEILAVPTGNWAGVFVSLRVITMAYKTECCHGLNAKRETCGVDNLTTLHLAKSSIGEEDCRQESKPMNPLCWNCFRFPVLLINATRVPASCSDSHCFHYQKALSSCGYFPKLQPFGPIGCERLKPGDADITWVCGGNFGTALTAENLAGTFVWMVTIAYNTGCWLNSM